MSESELRRELSSISAPLRARLEASGFDAERLVSLAAPLFARASRRGDGRPRRSKPGPRDGRAARTARHP